LRRIAKLPLECRSVVQGAKAIPHRVFRQIDIHVPFEFAVFEPVQHVHCVLIEGQRDLVGKALLRWRDQITLVGLEACPLSEWLYGGLLESGFKTVCIETRHALRFLWSRPNKTDRSDPASRLRDSAGLGEQSE
jgi:hypothetical protein